MPRSRAQLGHLADTVSADGELAGTIANFHSTSEELRLAVAENRALLRTTHARPQRDRRRTAKRLTTDREAQLRKTLDHFAARPRTSTGFRAASTRCGPRCSGREPGRPRRGHARQLVRDDQLYDDLNASVRR